MKLAVVVVFTAEASTGWGSVECPLNPSQIDELLTLPVSRGGKPVDLVLDTGSAETVLFHPSGAAIGQVSKYQDLSLRLSPEPQREPTIIQCSVPVHLDGARDGVPSDTDLPNVADGILGIGGPAFKSPSFLFSSSAPKWNLVSVTVPLHVSESGKLGFHDRVIRKTISTSVPVVSDYYWAGGMDTFSFGDRSIESGQNAAVVFDTGANFFGLSPGLMRQVKQAIAENGCEHEFTLGLTSQGEPVTMKFSPADYTLDGDCNSLALSQIDQSTLGDLADREVFIVGTRGLRGKTVSLHKQSSSKQPRLFLTLN